MPGPTSVAVSDAFAQRVLKYIATRGITFAELAHRLGISKRSVEYMVYRQPTMVQGVSVKVRRVSAVTVRAAELLMELDELAGAADLALEESRRANVLHRRQVFIDLEDSATRARDLVRRAHDLPPVPS